MLLRIKNIIDSYLKIESGQATVEAAIMIPVIFLILLLLIQPAILLYDLCVMNSAASETCRVLATCNEVEKQSVCDAFIKRRLGAIPQQDNFHMHSAGCSYQILLEGSQDTNEVKVSVKNDVKPLPIIGFLASVVGILNDNGCFEIESSSKETTKPSWALQSQKDCWVEQWVGRWLQ